MKRYLSREVIVEMEDGSIQKYPLSIVSVETDNAGLLKSYLIEPFSMELPGVEYVENPIKLKLRYKLKIG